MSFTTLKRLLATAGITRPHEAYKMVDDKTCLGLSQHFEMFLNGMLDKMIILKEYTLIKILTSKILQKQKKILQKQKRFQECFEHRSISLIKLQTFLQQLRQSFLNIVRIA